MRVSTISEKVLMEPHKWDEGYNSLAGSGFHDGKEEYPQTNKSTNDGAQSGYYGECENLTRSGSHEREYQEEHKADRGRDYPDVPTHTGSVFRSDGPDSKGAEAK